MYNQSIMKEFFKETFDCSIYSDEEMFVMNNLMFMSPEEFEENEFDGGRNIKTLSWIINSRRDYQIAQMYKEEAEEMKGFQPTDEDFLLS